MDNEEESTEQEMVYLCVPKDDIEFWSLLFPLGSEAIERYKTNI